MPSSRFSKWPKKFGAEALAPIAIYVIRELQIDPGLLERVIRWVQS
jgi:hypothetical protein